MQGFIVFDYTSEYAAARKQLAQWLAEGKIQRKETIVKGGLQAAEKALVGLYEGVNTGKFLLAIVWMANANVMLGKLLVEVKADNAGKSKLWARRWMVWKPCVPIMQKSSCRMQYICFTKRVIQHGSLLLWCQPSLSTRTLRYFSSLVPPQQLSFVHIPELEADYDAGGTTWNFLASTGFWALK